MNCASHQQTLAKIIGVLLLLAIVFNSETLCAQARLSEMTEKQFEEKFNRSINNAHLSFNLPAEFKPIKMSEVNFGIWHCKGAFPVVTFHRIFLNADSSIAIAIRIMYHNLNKPLEERAKIDWKQDAKNGFEYFADTIKSPPVHYDKDYLKKIWSSDFGVQYSIIGCLKPYMNKFTHNRISYVADNNRNVMIAFFYSEKSKQHAEKYLKAAAELIKPNKP